MCDINAITLVGRLTRDPEVRSFGNGTHVVNFCVAANHRYRDAKNEWHVETAFVPGVVFGKQTEEVKSLRKGERLIAIGRLKTESWEQEGTRKSRLILVAEAVHRVSSAPDSSLPTPPSETPSKITPQAQAAAPF